MEDSKIMEKTSRNTFENSSFSNKTKRKDNVQDRPFNDEKMITSVHLGHPKSCPILSIQGLRHSKNSIDNPKHSAHCKPWKQTEDTCRRASRYYQHKDVYCSSESEQNTVNNEICSLKTTKYRQIVSKRFHVHCNPDICQSGRLFLGSIDVNSGILPIKTWQEFRSAQDLALALPGIILDNIKNGFSFCLLRCVKSKDNIDQLLTFPNVLEITNKKASTMNKKVTFNINIVVLDSVSRNHFYRMLPNTVRALSEADAMSEVEVLDFEFLQSLAPYTYTNIFAFMTGKVDEAFMLQINKTFGTKHLFGAFKEIGYTTLFQEESCWYDNWGSILTSNIRTDKVPKDLQEFRKSWLAFRNMTSQNEIDDYGLTHFSCNVYQMHGVTNIFNKPLKICYDGKPFGHYMLSYVQDVFTAVDSNNRDPIFSYFHANTGHDRTGVRIKVIDKPLAAFVEDMAALKDTLTIILSDHGPKTTAYSQTTLYGRYETYDSFMFMIIPEKVKEKLGPKRMAALAENQKSLITMVDIHDTLMNISSKEESTKQTIKPRGLFSNMISNRSCDSLGMVGYGVCKCSNWAKIFHDQSPKFLLLAEFAVGALNDEIKQQLSQNTHAGFGKCQKLRLNRIRNIHQRVSNHSYLTTFDLVVQPLESIFLIQTTHVKKAGSIHNLTMKLWRRVSIFRHFGNCKDPSVAIELCVCYNRHRRSTRKLWRMIKRARMNRGMKIVEQPLSCLFIISSNPTPITTYDVVNLCEQHYKFTVHSSQNSAVFSAKFPIITELQPKTTNFLFSVFVKDKRQPKIMYTYTQLKMQRM